MPKSSPEETLERIRDSIGEDEVRTQAQRICRSRAFENQTTSQRLLAYLSERAINRRPPSPREIASDVLGKKIFNPKLDGCVRVAMKHLREKLAKYYDGEAEEKEIVLYMPQRQYNVLWRHSPKTLLGQTEFGGWVLSSSKLNAEGAQKAASTIQRFWPHLGAAFPVYCTEDFPATVDNGRLTLPDALKMFFDSIGNHHVFITTFNRSLVLIYPLTVWLEQWASIKSSEEGTGTLNVLEHWGHSAEIENGAEIAIHPKLLSALNLPKEKPFKTQLSFHPDGFIRFEVPKPALRPVGKYNLYCLSYAPKDTEKAYYFILVSLENDEAFNKALKGSNLFNLKTYGTIVESGRGDAPEGIGARLLAKYGPVIARLVTEPDLPLEV